MNDRIVNYYFLSYRTQTITMHQYNNIKKNDETMN